MMHINFVLYAHGLGGSPASSKAVLVREHFERRGAAVEIPSLAIPNLQRLSPIAARDYLVERIRALSSSPLAVVASSFGAFLVLHAVKVLQTSVSRLQSPSLRLILLAPVIDPWHAGSSLLSRDTEQRWRAQGEMPVLDLARGVEVNVHYRFVEELHHLGVAPVVEDVPTLVVHGVRDEVVAIEQSRSYASSAACVRLVEVDDDHSLLSRPPELLSSIDTFLAHDARGVMGSEAGE